MARYVKIPKKIAASAALVALLGTAAATLSLNTIANHEGLVLSAYKDPVGVWTKCFGDTKNVTPGKTYTLDQCVESLNAQVHAHAKPVLKCVPNLENQHPYVVTAFVSMAYNIGTNGFCSSSVAALARAGQWQAACRRIAEIYTTAKGKKLPGLVKRRSDESRLCLDGLSAETPGIELKY